MVCPPSSHPLCTAQSFVSPLNRPLPPHRLPPRRTLAGLAALLLGGAPLALLAQPGAPAQPPAEQPMAELPPAPALRASPQLQEQLPPARRAQQPVFVRGDQLSGQPDIQASIEGHAELRRSDTVIHAERMHYDVASDRAQASGNVLINRAGNRYQGTRLDLQVDAFHGFFDDARYRLLATGAHGQAQRVDFIDHDHSVIHQATYTTCQRDDQDSWQPDWVLRARRIELDQAEDVGRAEDGVLEFKGLPILPLPGISFPLSDKRKTGLLPPTLGLDSVSGLEYAQPWYWNIAPQRDATITPMLMSRRGVALAGELRYLEPRHSGELAAQFMPNDRLRERDRWAWRARQGALLDAPLLGPLVLGLNIQRVSDDNYWRDFTQRGSVNGGGNSLAGQQAQRLLPGDASLSWAQGAQSASLRVLKWQTLQDPLSPITPPYDRLPQWHWRYAPTQLPLGLDASVDADYTHFSADQRWYAQPNARRSYAMAQLSRPFLAPGGFITPRLQLHATRYEFDSPLPGGMHSAARNLPTFSLDSGLIFERDASFFGRAFLQTLEPRAFYTYTPYRDQSRLPVYDTAATDFNFATVYTENAFGGNDRIADNNLLTLGATTRLLEPSTGGELVRLGIAQRLRFTDQRVTMPGALPVSERLSDVLLGAGIHWTPAWSLDSSMQYNPKNGEFLRSTLAMRYSPGAYRTVSAAYRMQKITDLITQPSKQLDLGWQWPLNDLWGDHRSRPAQDAGRWYSVGRLNYSLQDRKFVDTVLGLEYESCCWIGRVVLERLQRSLDSSSTRIMLQLEFLGFSRLSLGANPLAALRQHVPRYQNLGDNSAVPSRFTQYD